MLDIQLKRGLLDVCVLRCLADGDSYGYQINKNVTALSGGAFEMKEATLYTAFRRLEAAGLIRSYWGDETTGARRRYYAITEAGFEKLAQDCNAWEETKIMMDRLLKEDVE